MSGLILLLRSRSNIDASAIEGCLKSKFVPLIETTLPEYCGLDIELIEHSGEVGIVEPRLPDALIAIRFSSETLAKRAFDMVLHPEVSARFKQACGTVIDPTASQLLLVDRAETDIPDEAAGGPVKIKSYAIICRLKHVSRRHFKAYYETHHAPFALTLLPMMAGYSRNHVVLSAGDAGAIDCVTEISFRDEDGVATFLQTLDESRLMDRIREDEANFLDGSKTTWFRVRSLLRDREPNYEKASI